MKLKKLIVELSVEAELTDEKVVARIIESLNDEELLVSVLEDKKFFENQEAYYENIIEDCSFFEQYIINDRSGKIATFVLNNSRLKQVYFDNNELVGAIAAVVAKYNPQLINRLLLDDVIVSKIVDTSPHYFTDILSYSADKKAADWVFSHSDVYGEFDDGMKAFIYRKIAENFRREFPDSLLKHSLYAVKAHHCQTEELPSEIQELYSNFWGKTGN